MSTINEVAEILRIPINAIAEAQKKLQAMKAFPDRKEYLAKEIATLGLTTAEVSLLGVNDICSNTDNCEEYNLAMIAEGMKQSIELIKPPTDTVA